MTDTPENQRPATIAIDEHDTLPQVLDRVRARRGGSLTLEIPDHSPILLTANEFRTLRDIADRSGLTLSLKTDDPLRLQLGSMFGLSNWRREAHADDATLDGEMASTPSFQGWRSARAKHSERMSEVGTEDPIAVSRRRRSALYEPAAAPALAPVLESNVGLSDDASHVSLSYLDADPGAARARLIGRIVAVVAVIALAAGISGWYFMPAVTVRATLLQGQIDTELLYSVTRPGADAPGDAAFAVEAVEVSDTVAFDISVPATGLDVTPDETASGMVTLRNASTEAVTIPAGTILSTVTGLEYVTEEDAEVPPGSPDGSTIGEVTVPVTANAPGAASNLGIGELSGQVSDLPVYFSNRESDIAGGTDIEVAVVTEADIETLEGLVANDLHRAVAEDWSAQLPEGQVILTPSVQASDSDYTIEESAGTVSDTVTLRGTVQASGLEYDQASVESQARTYYQQALAEQAPQGYEIVPESVELGEPRLVAESPNSVEYEMMATASVRARFSDDDRRSLIDDLSGADQSQAESILGNIPAFSSWSIETNPSWWLDRMPQSTGRIKLDIDDTASDLVTPVDEASPPATPEGDPA